MTKPCHSRCSKSDARGGPKRWAFLASAGLVAATVGISQPASAQEPAEHSHDSVSFVRQAASIVLASAMQSAGAGGEAAIALGLGLATARSEAAVPTREARLGLRAARLRVSGPADQRQPRPTMGPYLGVFTVTCYSIYGDTASGIPASSAVVAVDPSVIPLGTRIFIGGVGLRLAADTGGAIIGDRLDIWEPTVGECDAFGVRELPVWKA
jgi:3D (Asp-Asp-Asp) domain-containing protein